MRVETDLAVRAPCGPFVEVKSDTWTAPLQVPWRLQRGEYPRGAPLPCPLGRHANPPDDAHGSARGRCATRRLMAPSTRYEARGWPAGCDHRRPVPRRTVRSRSVSARATLGVRTRPGVGVGRARASTLRSTPSGGQHRPCSREWAAHGPDPSLHQCRDASGKTAHIRQIRRFGRSDGTRAALGKGDRGGSRRLPRQNPPRPHPPVGPPANLTSRPVPPRMRRSSSPTSLTVACALQDRTHRTGVLSARSAQERPQSIVESQAPAVSPARDRFRGPKSRGHHDRGYHECHTSPSCAGWRSQPPP